MKKENPQRSQAIFAYKTCARSLIALLSLCVIYSLAFLKAGPFDYYEKGILIEGALIRIDTLIAHLPTLDIQNHARQRIEEWGFPTERMVKRSDCDPKSTFYHLFLPWEADSQLAVNTLLSRFRDGIKILTKDPSTEPKSLDLGGVFLCHYVLMSNPLDSAFLANHYYEDRQLDPTELGLIAIGKRRHIDSLLVKTAEERWLLDLTNIHSIWDEYKDSVRIAGDFSFKGLHKLVPFLKAPRSFKTEVVFPTAGKIDIDKAFYLLSPLIFILLLFTSCFYYKANRFESIYWKNVDRSGNRFQLSSIASAIFFFLEDSGPTVPRLFRNAVTRFFRVAASLLVSVLHLLVIVGFPSCMSILLPLLMQALLPSRIWVGIYYGVFVLNLSLAIWLFCSVEFKKYKALTRWQRRP